MDKEGVQMLATHLARVKLEAEGTLRDLVLTDVSFVVSRSRVVRQKRYTR